SIDEEKRRLYIVDRNDCPSVGRNRYACQCARSGNLSQKLPLRKIDDGNGDVFLILGVEVLSVRCDYKAMTIGRTGVERVHDRSSRPVNDRNHGAVFASDVDQSVGAQLQGMRRDVWAQVDIDGMRALFEIDDAEQMAGIWVTAVDPVAENR